MPDSATRNTTDLRRARQHARSVVRGIQGEMTRFLKDRGIELLDAEEYQRLNQMLSRIAGRGLRQDLLRWLEQRRLTTMARAVRAAFEQMKRAFSGEVPDTSFTGTPNLSRQDRSLNQKISQIDAGLLYAEDGSLAEEVGNRLTRILRLGFSQGERVPELAERVEFVLTDGKGDDRQSAGVTGQTIMSKAELIAHDSIQDAYTTSAHRRYLENGFRYAIYDAVVDFKTSDVCTRMNEYVIDLVETPFLVPPLHPWCRSGIRPQLDIGDRSVLTPEDIADHHLQTIMATRSYRPTVLDTEQAFQPTHLTQRFQPA